MVHIKAHAIIKTTYQTTTMKQENGLLELHLQLVNGTKLQRRSF